MPGLGQLRGGREVDEAVGVIDRRAVSGVDPAARDAAPASIHGPNGMPLPRPARRSSMSATPTMAAEAPSAVAQTLRQRERPQARIEQRLGVVGISDDDLIERLGGTAVADRLLEQGIDGQALVDAARRPARRRPDRRRAGCRHHCSGRRRPP